MQHQLQPAQDILFRPLRFFWQPFGADIFCFGKKFLVFNLVSRNLKIKYRRSILGLFWTLLTPMAMSAIYYFVFKVVLRVSIPHHLIFILSGVLVWNFISSTVLEGMESIAANVGLLTKVPVPVQVFPFVGALTNFSTLILATPVLIAATLFSAAPLTTAIFAFPVYAGLIFLMTYGISFTVGIFLIRLRDLRHIMGILMQIWFYASPVVYDESMIPEKYQWVMYLNPFGMAFADLHSIWVHGQWPSLSHFSVVVMWTTIIVLITALVHKYLSRGLIEQI
jgi:ABC-type polysaccharide/polyol phosphate export permease